MLVDIEIDFANIFQENKNIRNAMVELTTTVREIATLKPR